MKVNVIVRANYCGADAMACTKTKTNSGKTVYNAEKGLAKQNTQSQITNTLT